jgi:hypothetical protein
MAAHQPNKSPGVHPALFAAVTIVAAGVGALVGYAMNAGSPSPSLGSAKALPLTTPTRIVFEANFADEDLRDELFLACSRIPMPVGRVMFGWAEGVVDDLLANLDERGGRVVPFDDVVRDDKSGGENLVWEGEVRVIGGEFTFTFAPQVPPAAADEDFMATRRRSHAANFLPIPTTGLNRPADDPYTQATQIEMY